MDGLCIFFCFFVLVLGDEFGCFLDHFLLGRGLGHFNMTIDMRGTWNSPLFLGLQLFKARSFPKGSFGFQIYIYVFMYVCIYIYTCVPFGEPILQLKSPFSIGPIGDTSSKGPLCVAMLVY